MKALNRDITIAKSLAGSSQKIPMNSMSMKVMEVSIT